MHKFTPVPSRKVILQGTTFSHRPDEAILYGLYVKAGLQVSYFFFQEPNRNFFQVNAYQTE